VLVAAAELDRMVHPDEARRIVLSQVRRLAVEQVALGDAAWRVLAEDVVATEDHPPFPAATMDGYAVVASDASPWREVLGEQMAGQVLDLEVSEGAVVRIMTGAPMPRGADAVVRVEATEPAEDHVVILQEDVAPGENIRTVGSDVRRGEVVLPAGTVLGPAELGLVAAVGFVPVPVSTRPRVSVVSTGDELVEPGEPVGPGQIRDSNRFSLVAALGAAGASVTWSGKAPDSAVSLRALLIERMAESDVVITSGGVSMGDLDLIKPLLGDLTKVHFRRVFMKPGKPLNFATTAGGALVFGLPGNPVSALVSFETFIRPALRSMMGCASIDRPRVSVALAQGTPPSDRIEMQRATVRVDPEGQLVATTTGSQASSRLASFLGANALLVVAPRETPYEPGERVDAVLLGPPLGPE
jgi:molybdenum cofactor synthesis domain-containing protein